jgi:hypothetical protein
MTRQKPEIITFKVDASMARLLRRIPNRSEYIRAAVLAALDSTCPLCSGTGKLTVEQRQHWEDFSVKHPIQECAQCQETHLVCIAEGGKGSPPSGAGSDERR